MYVSVVWEHYIKYMVSTNEAYILELNKSNNK